MRKFSERYAPESVEKIFQKDEATPEFRTKLWNALRKLIWDASNKKVEVSVLSAQLWIHFFNYDLDKMPNDFLGIIYGMGGRDVDGCYDIYKKFFMRCQWNEVYDFLEYICQERWRVVDQECLGALNHVFEEFNAAYRFVGRSILEITDQHEIGAIKEALSDEHETVVEHLKKSMHFLSDRTKPDYQNSIKESISAVEAACRLMTGESTLGRALSKMASINPVLKTAFEKLYAYTNDASGVRHANKDLDENANYADAKFMLVACAAFISYLKTAPKNS